MANLSQATSLTHCQETNGVQVYDANNNHVHDHEYGNCSALGSKMFVEVCIPPWCYLIFTSRDARPLVRRCQWLRISFCAGALANPHVRQWTWRGRRIRNSGMQHVAIRGDNTLCNTSSHLGRSWMSRIYCICLSRIDAQDLLYHSLKANKFMTSLKGKQKLSIGI